MGRKQSSSSSLQAGARAYKDPRGERVLRARTRGRDPRALGAHARRAVARARLVRAHAGPWPVRARCARMRGRGPCALGARACEAVARALVVRAPAEPWAYDMGMPGARAWRARAARVRWTLR